MNAREVVTRAVEFRRPARLPINGYGEASDCTGVGHDPVKPPQAGDDPLVDQWLCRWEKTATPNMGQVKGHPLADLAAMKDYPWPDGNDPRRYEKVPQRLAELKADPKRCGKINKALPGLIEAGLNVINMQQPRTNGIEEIGSQFGGRICFETLCDIQKTLPRGDRSEIEAEAELLLKRWGRPEGGFIFGDYGDHAAIGAQSETKQFMLDTFRRLDPYAKR